LSALSKRGRIATISNGTLNVYFEAFAARGLDAAVGVTFEISASFFLGNGVVDGGGSFRLTEGVGV